MGIGTQNHPRTLVFGAGVLGCFLAHQLAAEGAAEVTLLARGAWAQTLRQDGLVIRHWAQRRTTTDRVRVIEELTPDDTYDLVFVCLQAAQIEDALPLLAANASERVVFVGNNVSALDTQERLDELAHAAGRAAKEAAFGFQSSGGRREDGRVIAIYLKLKMTIGAAESGLSAEFAQLIEGVLSAAGYETAREDQMDAWLKCHAAYVLPIAFAAYACDCDLRRADRALMADTLAATGEIYGLFARRGIPIRPEADDAYFRPGPKHAFMVAFTWLVFKTPLGPLVATDHCRHAVAEMRYLTQGLEAPFGVNELHALAPTWYDLKARMPSWEALLANPCAGTGSRE